MRVDGRVQCCPQWISGQKALGKDHERCAIARCLRDHRRGLRGRGRRVEEYGGNMGRGGFENRKGGHRELLDFRAAWSGPGVSRVRSQLTCIYTTGSSQQVTLPKDVLAHAISALVVSAPSTASERTAGCGQKRTSWKSAFKPDSSAEADLEVVEMGARSA